MSTDAPSASNGDAAPEMTALDFNLPKGDKFVVNSRGQKLHVRTFSPKSSPPKAVLFWYPGYAAHINGPTFVEFVEGMSSNGFVVLSADNHGHGYSDGETVFIQDYRHLLEDALLILDGATRGQEDGDEWRLGMDSTLREALTTLPIFLGGQSLGGALALLLSLKVRSDESRADIAARFVGVMTNCPAIVANPPPRAVVMVMKYVIVPLFPHWQIPSFMEKVSLPEKVWVKKEHMEMGVMDKIGRPGGLGWPGTMRMGTGAQLLDMVATLESRLAEVDFPFIVLHDPDDGIVRFEGTETLLEMASTPDDIARGKELHRMDGMKHDLLSNATQQMLTKYLDWAGARLELFDGSKGTQQ